LPRSRAYRSARRVFAINPRVGLLPANDIVIVDLEDRTIEVYLCPSSDTQSTAFYSRHLKAFAHVVRTHSRDAIAFDSDKSLPKTKPFIWHANRRPNRNRRQSRQRTAQDYVSGRTCESTLDSILHVYM
jgi:ribulose-5-phosphate 4-epimerase/fuculose-1-phosphate aldolase